MTAPAAPAVDGGAVTVLDVSGIETLVQRGGAGSPLLYLHGLAGDVHASFAPDRWTPFLARLVASRQVIAPALPGYPGTGGLDELREVEDHVFFLLDLLDALGVRQVDVVGHSLGGWLGAELAVRRPDRVGRLALVDPLGVHVPGAPVASFFGAVAPRGVGGFAEARGVLFAQPSGEAARRALPDDMDEAQQLRWFGGLAGAARLGWRAPQLQSRALTRRLRRITAPTLVVRGASDRLVADEHLRAWTSGIDGSTAVTVEDAGHCAPLEQPDAVAAAVLGHL